MFGRQPPSYSIAQSEKPVKIIDVETRDNAVKICDLWTGYMHRLLNEPSVGLHRISDHVNRNAPLLRSRKLELDRNKNEIEEQTLDVDYAITAVQDITKIKTFESILEKMQHCRNEMIKFEQSQRQAAKLAKEELMQKRSTPATPANPPAPPLYREQHQRTESTQSTETSPKATQDLKPEERITLPTVQPIQNVKLEYKNIL
ncbi:hypothetical protein AKO1_014686 [Acrasis kona]|uniref:Uncharacterized protein n=1 Tax=Acrasis kona TaxID=1008807 RepID=A0AAW2Z330_9EUKA